MKTKLIKLCPLMLNLVLGSFAFAGDQPNPEVVTQVDLNRYSGLWYDIAHSPNFFQRRCKQSTAQYEVLNSSQISVFNTCYHANGKVKTISGTASILSQDEPAKLRVVFNTLFKPKGAYWIVALDPNYQWAVVSGPKKRYNFILSRTFPMEKGTLYSILENLKGRGFNTENFVFDEAVTQH